MKRKTCKKFLTCFFCMVLIAAMALTAVGCAENPQTGKTPFKDGQTVGTGDTQFTLVIVDPEGKTVTLQVKTDKTILGEALLELEIVDGEAGAYGLYIKTVNGRTLDYNTDGKFWALYEGDVMASTGADGITITNGATYALKAE